MTKNRCIRLSITRDIALAVYFLMTSWPNPVTAPELGVADSPMTICFELEGAAYDDLQKTLKRASAEGGEVAEGADVLLQTVEGNIARPDPAPPSATG